MKFSFVLLLLCLCISNEQGANAKVEEEGVWTELHQAAKDGKIEFVKLLVEIGANVSARSEDSWTPLHIATQFGKTSNN